jgi:GT2 family glycosyltransferase
MMVSIIIVNYRVDQDVIKCIKSIYALKFKQKYEIIVVDNSEKDILSSKLKNQFQDVIYLKTGINLGFGGGNNFGARHARGEYLFFLNPDTEIIGNVIDGLSKFIIENKNVGIVAPQILDVNRKPHELQGASELTPWKAFLNLSFFSKIFSRLGFKDKYYISSWDKNGLKKVDVCPGTAFMISSNVFNSIKGFDEKFFLYFEEFDLCKRVRSLGLDIYMTLNCKVIHKIGKSTAQIKDKDKYFSKSRFYYFKKHFGVLKAIIVETVLKINKVTILLSLLVILGLILRLYNLQNGMPFIGDQGWFYISARDFLIHSKVPLVGITSSHLWLHQGPLWTYMLSLVLPIFKFNPLAGAYLTIFTGMLTVILIYKFTSEMFSKNVGLIAALLYSFSPAIVALDRTPFDPSPIPLFVLLYYYCVYKWINGNIKFFPLILTLLAILYNLELATFSMSIAFLVIFIYGFLKKKEWILKLKSIKIIIFSIIAVLLPMLPILIYDFGNGFKQTVVFLGWVIYKPFSFLLHNAAKTTQIDLVSFGNFLLDNSSKLIFAYSWIVAVLIFVFSLLYLLIRVFKKKEFNSVLLLLFMAIGLGAVLVNHIPSDAYLPVIFPFVIIMMAIGFNCLASRIKITYLILVFILLLNFYSALRFDLRNDLLNRIKASDKIISLTNGQKYNLIGKGVNSQFESFTKNYEYILWWKGFPPSKTNQKIKIILAETNNGIIISKK